MYQSDTP
jgi:hypothetical protein